MGESGAIAQMRASLAGEFGADAACPLTSGIGARIGAEVALEELAMGKSKDSVAPFWRLIDPKSPHAKKLPCGPDLVRTLRLAEGIG